MRFVIVWWAVLIPAVVAAQECRDAYEPALNQLVRDEQWLNEAASK